jgi:hypothetical protein
MGRRSHWRADPSRRFVLGEEEPGSERGRDPLSATTGVSAAPTMRPECADGVTRSLSPASGRIGSADPRVAKARADQETLRHPRTVAFGIAWIQRRTHARPLGIRRLLVAQSVTQFVGHERRRPVHSCLCRGWCPTNVLPLLCLVAHDNESRPPTCATSRQASRSQSAVEWRARLPLGQHPELDFGGFLECPLERGGIAWRF